jgi:hypothetical protein
MPLRTKSSNISADYSQTTAFADSEEACSFLQTSVFDEISARNALLTD